MAHRGTSCAMTEGTETAAGSAGGRKRRATGGPAPRHAGWVFGYGSLVNARTHGYPRVLPARARGWRRIWRHARDRNVAFLSVHEAEGAEIAGVVAAVPADEWPALDQRERAYERTALSEVLHQGPAGIEVQIYRARPELTRPPSPDHPILMSYLEVVAEGFLAVWGEPGV
ncbi:MAG: gamma-glutamylcyclotransferase, partial [Alphaproteobacteria bacterium]